jgi:hypothetical protein
MEFTFEQINGERCKGEGLLTAKDFKPEESDGIIESLVKKIKTYEETKGRAVEAVYTMGQSGRITRVKMRSNDGVVEGVIFYEGPYADYRTEIGAKVMAEFDFKSKSDADKQEYLDLCRIIRQI